MNNHFPRRLHNALCFWVPLIALGWVWYVWLTGWDEFARYMSVGNWWILNYTCNHSKNPILEPVRPKPKPRPL